MAKQLYDNKILQETYKIVSDYIISNYSKSDTTVILNEIKELFLSVKIYTDNSVTSLSYEEVQNILSTINEKQESRKKNGVYYTENDITTFILKNCFKLYCNKSVNTLINSDLTIKEKSKVLPLSIFDPTCGSGAFLLAALEYKSKIIVEKKIIEENDIKELISSLYGNDIENESIIITKLRLLLSILHIFGPKYISGISEILNNNFTSLNVFDLHSNKKYDLVIGNPPYVEASSTDMLLQEKFGNIYANVLNKSLDFLKKKSCFGFIIPISYISTPRMSKIRNRMASKLRTQFIFSYADRPGCLFTSVHQKLNILIGATGINEGLYTGNYQYWYKEERPYLFKNIEYIKNDYVQELFIPKLGNRLEINIYEKINNFPETLTSSIYTDKTDNSIYLNMRACFWIKAFLNRHTTGEYKQIYFANQDLRNYIYCILNSSLYWWFWIKISDCWHITNKEFESFKLPRDFDCFRVEYLAWNLENRLEETKKYVGSKQTDYEYKHKLCVNEIHEIDDYINQLFHLTNEESEYIKRFALIYRTSKG